MNLFEISADNLQTTAQC